jgi:hypothetical protein
MGSIENLMCCSDFSVPPFDSLCNSDVFMESA